LPTFKEYIFSDRSNPVDGGLFRTRDALEIWHFNYEDAGHADGPLNYHSKAWRGWFKAPATGNYTFYMTSDD